MKKEYILESRWLNAIKNKRPESEIREYKKAYIKEVENAEKTKPKNPRKEP